MRNCSNDNPCSQGLPKPCSNPCPDPCLGVREDEVVIKQYVDECGRKVYPITTDAAVMVEDNVTLEETLRNYINYLNSILEELSNLRGDHDNYNESFIDLTARIRILERMQLNPYTFDITSILSRLSVLEAKSDQGCDTERIDECYTLCKLILVAINNINIQIQELFNQIGEDCISDFSTPLLTFENTEIGSRSGSSPWTLATYNSGMVYVYKVTPGSILNIIGNVVSNNYTGSGRNGELYLFYSIMPTINTSVDQLNSNFILESRPGSKITAGTSSETYNNLDVIVPDNAKCVAITNYTIGSEPNIVTLRHTISLVDCPEEDEDTCWFEEWIDNLKNTYRTLLAVIDDTVKDVTFAGESIVGESGADLRIATVPPFIALHGYVKPLDSLSEWHKNSNNLKEPIYVYNTGYFLDASLRNYNSTNKPKINRGILLPVTKLYDYTLYHFNRNFYYDWLIQTNNSDLLTAHPGIKYLTSESDLKQGVFWASPALDKYDIPDMQSFDVNDPTTYYKHNPVQNLCGATSNYVVDFYNISSVAQKYNLKLTFKNLFGDSCRYSLFERTCSDLTYPDATDLDNTKHISNADSDTILGTDNDVILGAFSSTLVETSNVYVNWANDTTSITLEDIPSSVKTLCVSYHSFGSVVVEKLPKKLTNSNGSLSVPANSSITIEGPTNQELTAIDTACSGTALTYTNVDGDVTITNSTDNTITIALQLEPNRKIIWNEEPIEMDPTPTPMEGTPMLATPRPLTTVTVNYYNNFKPTDTDEPNTFKLAPRVPFYEIDTLRFMYVNESGTFYEC